MTNEEKQAFANLNKNLRDINLELELIKRTIIESNSVPILGEIVKELKKLNMVWDTSDITFL